MNARRQWAAPRLDFRLRSATAADQERVGRFLAAMDREGLYERHFAHGEAPNQALLRRLGDLDHGDRVAILAVDGEGEVVGHGEYVAQGGAAEFALLVLPRHRQQGIGRNLLLALRDIAGAAGQRRLHGMIQAGNTRALKLALSCGLRVLPSDDRSVVIVSAELAAALHHVPDMPTAATVRLPLRIALHDADRTSLHCRSGARASLWPRGG